MSGHGFFTATGAIAAATVGLFDFKGATDASGNPNYPAASKGDAYAVSVAGKVGGASGTSVEVGDVYVASADNAGGTQAGVGTSWFVLQANLVGALLAANNLSDLASVATARTNLGVSLANVAAVGASLNNVDLTNVSDLTGSAGGAAAAGGDVILRGGTGNSGADIGAFVVVGAGAGDGTPGSAAIEGGAAAVGDPAGRTSITGGGDTASGGGEVRTLGANVFGPGGGPVVAEGGVGAAGIAGGGVYLIGGSGDATNDAGASITVGGGDGAGNPGSVAIVNAETITGHPDNGLTLTAPTAFMQFVIGVSQGLIISGLPALDPGIPGALYQTAGVVKISL